MSIRRQCVVFFAGLLLCRSQGFANGGSMADAHRAYHPTAPSQNAATVYPGSLKANIIRLAQQFGWRQVVWKSADDYRWSGSVRFNGSVMNIFRQILKDYPLQARFYQGNHVLVIVPRAL